MYFNLYANFIEYLILFKIIVVLDQGLFRTVLYVSTFRIK